jgi:hypothetical protein
MRRWFRGIGKMVLHFVDGWGLIGAWKSLGLASLPSNVQCLGASICSACSICSCSVAITVGLGIVAVTLLGSVMHLMIA